MFRDARLLQHVYVKYTFDNKSQLTSELQRCSSANRAACNEGIPTIAISLVKYMSMTSSGRCRGINTKIYNTAIICRR